MATKKSLPAKKTSKKTTKKPTFKTTERKVTLYISGLRYDKDEEGVMWFFTPFGYVESVQLIKDKNTKLPKGIAFVKMERESDGLKAVKGLDGKVVEGRTLKVSVAKERPEFKKEFTAKDPSKPVRKTTKEENMYKAKAKKEKKTGLDKLLKYKSSKK